MLIFQGNLLKLLLLSQLLFGCVYSVENSVSIMDSPTDDDAYFESYTKATRHAQVIKHFEKKYSVTATLLSTDFQKAFTHRFSELYKKDQIALTETSDKIGFFVSLYTPDREIANLKNDKIWGVFIDSGDKKTEAVQMTYLHEKERWTPFFPRVTPWTREYLILFDRSDINLPEVTDESSKGLLKFIVTNADAAVELNW